MEQEITITIGDTPFKLKAKSPEDEELIRRAANTVGRKLEAFQAKYHDRSLADLLSFICLNECMRSLSLKAELDALKAGQRELCSDLSSYLNEAKDI